MEYKKPALTLEEQANILIKRGLIADREELKRRLCVVNYYRLSGYLYYFRNPDDTFKEGTTLDKVWKIYNFDRRLRILLLDAIERIEVAVRTRLVFHFVHIHGPFGHVRKENLPRLVPGAFFKRIKNACISIIRLKGLPKNRHKEWLQKVRFESERAFQKKSPYVTHFHRKYGDRHDDLPLWVACELIPCGMVLTLAEGMEQSLIRKTAADFGIPDALLISWIRALFSLRNACAHHARIWNVVVGVRPSKPGRNKFPNWYANPVFASDRLGMLLTVCHFWLSIISPTSRWKYRVFDLFDQYPEIPLEDMGIPCEWRNHPLWRDQAE